MKSILLISHGSHSPKTKSEVKKLLKELQIKNPGFLLKYAFLEIESPSIPEGIKSCVDQGAKQVIVLLNFLNSGKHVDEDIPRIVAEAKKEYPHVSFQITIPVGQHPKIHQLFSDLIQ